MQLHSSYIKDKETSKSISTYTPLGGLESTQYGITGKESHTTYKTMIGGMK
jgi:hypothetical protein